MLRKMLKILEVPCDIFLLAFFLLWVPEMEHTFLTKIIPMTLIVML